MPFCITGYRCGENIDNNAYAVNSKNIMNANPYVGDVFDDVGLWFTIEINKKINYLCCHFHLIIHSDWLMIEIFDLHD